jgi:hypothetical protein
VKRAIFTAAVLVLAGAVAASPQGNTFCAANLGCTLTGLWNFTGGLQNNGVAVPTLPINLATQVTGTLPGANMVATNLAGGNTNGGVSGTLPGSNMAVFVASGASHAAGAVPDPGSSAGTTHFLREDATWATIPSGGSTVLNAQGNSGAVTGNSSAQVLYTYSLPGSTVATLKALRVTIGVSHSVGAANISYLLSLNGQNTNCNPSLSTAGGIVFTCTILNTAATTGVNTGFAVAGATVAGGTAALTGLAWGSSQTLQFTFNVANTDQVTPVLWLVEVVQ